MVSLNVEGKVLGIPLVVLVLVLVIIIPILGVMTSYHLSIVDRLSNIEQRLVPVSAVSPLEEASASAEPSPTNEIVRKVVPQLAPVPESTDSTK